MTTWFAPCAWLGGDRLARDVTIEVSHGKIVETRVGGFGSPSAVSLNGVVLPGMVSTHSHAFHRAIRGRAGGGDFWAWRTEMYEVAQRLDPASYERLATEVFAEMLRAGITTVGEFHYLHHQPDGTPYANPHAMEQALISAALEVGIRLTLLDACYLTSEVDGSNVTSLQRRFSDGSSEAWATRVQDLESAFQNSPVKIGVAAHSVRAVPPSAIAQVARTATEMAAPLHIHVSEQRSENAACLAEHGVTPTRLLADIGALGPRTTVIHATHLTESDIELYGTTGTAVCFCPTTERDLGDGIGPAIELSDRSVLLSLGSDSNAVVDPFAEMRALEMDDRLRLERRGVHTPESLLRAATVNGLAALGWGTHEPFAPGAPADFIVVSLDGSPGITVADDIGAVLSAIDRHSVTDVVVGGSFVVEGRANRSRHSSATLHGAIEAVTK